MPTYTSTVGPETLPLPVAGTDSALRDETIVGLLDYLAFWLRTDLSDKLAEMGGPTTSAAIIDACPAENLFPWDHGGTFMRVHPSTGATTAPLPGMWAWEVSCEPADDYATLLHRSVFRREIRVHYVFPLVQIPDGFNARSGLMSSVGRAFMRAGHFGSHTSYGYDGAPAGEPIWRTLQWRAFQFVKCEPGRIAVMPSGAAQNTGGRPGNEGHVQRFYPALSSTWHVWERVEPKQAAYPDDAMQDGTFTILTGDDVGDTTEILDRVLIGPDDLAP